MTDHQSIKLLMSERIADYHFEPAAARRRSSVNPQQIPQRARAHRRRLRLAAIRQVER
jgi:hypothetical protein